MLVLIHTKEREVLLIHRTDIPGFWQSVTGSLEEGETPAQAAVRELFEETGLQAVPQNLEHEVVYEIKSAWRKRFAPGVTHNTEHWFELWLDAPVPVTLDENEHSDFVWLPVEAALEQCSSASNRAAIERCVVSR